MARALMSRGLHKYPPTQSPGSGIKYGTREAKLLGSGDPIENPTDDTTPLIKGYLPPGWTLNTNLVYLFNGSAIYGPFDITSLALTLSIDVNTILPYGNYKVLYTPVTNTNGIDRPIGDTITIADPTLMLGAFHSVFNNAFKEVWEA